MPSLSVELSAPLSRNFLTLQITIAPVLAWLDLEEDHTLNITTCSNKTDVGAEITVMDDQLEVIRCVSQATGLGLGLIQRGMYAPCAGSVPGVSMAPPPGPTPGSAQAFLARAPAILHAGPLGLPGTTPVSASQVSWWKGGAATSSR